MTGVRRRTNEIIIGDPGPGACCVRFLAFVPHFNRRLSSGIKCMYRSTYTHSICIVHHTNAELYTEKNTNDFKFYLYCTFEPYRSYMYLHNYK